MPRLRRRWIGLGVVVAIGFVAALYFGLRTAPPWPSAFCQPVNRVVGVDATRILDLTPSSASGVGRLEDYQGLHHDIGVALKNAPAAQLRNELATYERATTINASFLQITTALSQFDSRVRTQLQRCGIRPIGN